MEPSLPSNEYESWLVSKLIHDLDRPNFCPSGTGFFVNCAEMQSVNPPTSPPMALKHASNSFLYWLQLATR